MTFIIPPFPTVNAFLVSSQNDISYTSYHILHTLYIPSGPDRWVGRVEIFSFKSCGILNPFVIPIGFSKIHFDILTQEHRNSSDGLTIPVTVTHRHWTRN